MGFVCLAGHFIGVNCSLSSEENWQTTCYCGRPTYPMINCRSN